MSWCLYANLKNVNKHGTQTPNWKQIINYAVLNCVNLNDNRSLSHQIIVFVFIQNVSKNYCPYVTTKFNLLMIMCLTQSNVIYFEFQFNI